MDGNRDRFIGDRRPLNSRERSIGRRAPALLPTTPTYDLGRIRDGADNSSRQPKTVFYLYEVPPSRVARQVISPRIPRGWLEVLDDESLDVKETAEIRKISLKHVPFKPGRLG